MYPHRHPPIISSSSRPLFSFPRLVITHASRPRLIPPSRSRPLSLPLLHSCRCDCPIASASHVPSPCPISIPSRHECEPATVNANKNELNKTAHPCCLMSLTRQANRKARTEHRRPDQAPAAPHTSRISATITTRAKRDGMRTRRWAKQDTRRRDKTRRPQQDTR